MKMKIFLSVFFLTVLIAAVFFLSDGKNRGGEIEKVCFREYCFLVELAETPEEKSYGLMFRENLEADKGMLFIFEKERKYGFWMKNTLIPLDIIWLDKDKKVVFIKSNASPCAEDSCPVINPETPAMYVLEINGGLAEKIGLTIGSKLRF